ncbi:MAG TPA: OsmC family protein [Pseudomonadales bacterium]
MQPFPHHYRAAVDLAADAEHVRLQSPGLPDLETDAPAEYDGPGDRWSPETLLVGAVADCYVLSFRAIARASSLDWRTLSCHVEGTLDKVDRTARFTRMRIRAEVTVPEAARTRAERILQKAEETCLITNSLLAEVDFEGVVHAA